MSSTMRWKNKTYELEEMRAELNNKKNNKKADAIKRIIGYMNIGKDVSDLFFDVTRCLEINSVEMKKLVYLYIIHYSRTRPDDSIVVINSFVRDANDKSNAIVRALAVRTMGCLRVLELCEYLIPPLCKALKDTDSYVQHNAVMCVPKVYELAPKLVEDNKILDIMMSVLEKCKNGQVVGNLLIAFSEINSLRPRQIEVVTDVTLPRILLALGETQEWSQVCILDFLAEYCPKSSSEAEKIIEKVLPRLVHINPAVVLSTCKVIIAYISVISSEDIIQGLFRKLTAPIATLLTSAPESCWIVLKSLQLVVQKYPTICSEVKIFFVRYSDPAYLKREKLKLIFNITNETNYEIVLGELNEYAYDVDPEFTIDAVRMIWRICLKVNESLAKYRNSSIVGNVSDSGSGDHFINEIMDGYQQIMRHYPKAMNYSENIKQIMKREGCIHTQTAKCSLLYILGEYAEIIPESGEIINTYIENIQQEEHKVQLQILTCAVKMYIKDQSNLESSISKLLQSMSENSDNADLRDRAFIYWRLLTADLEVAKKIIFGEKPATIIKKEQQIPFKLVDKLIPQLGYVTSVLHQDEFTLELDSEPFTKEEVFGDAKLPGEVQENNEPAKKQSAPVDLIGLDDLLGGDLLGGDFEEAPVPLPPQKVAEELIEITEPTPIHKPQMGLLQPPKKGDTGNTNTAVNQQPITGGDLLDFDLLGGASEPHNPSPTPSPVPQNDNFDLFDLGGHKATQQPQSVPHPTGNGMYMLVERTSAASNGITGVEILGGIVSSGPGVIGLSLSIFNSAANVLLITRVITEGGSPVQISGPSNAQIPPNSPFQGVIPLSMIPHTKLGKFLNLMIECGLFSYSVKVPLPLLLFVDRMRTPTSNDFKNSWPSLPSSVKNFGQASKPIGEIITRLSSFGVAHINTQNNSIAYFAARLVDSSTLLMELSLGLSVQVTVKSDNPAILEHFADCLSTTFYN